MNSRISQTDLNYQQWTCTSITVSEFILEKNQEIHNKDKHNYTKNGDKNASLWRPKYELSRNVSTPANFS